MVRRENTPVMFVQPHESRGVVELVFPVLNKHGAGAHAVGIGGQQAGGQIGGIFDQIGIDPQDMGEGG